MANKTKIIIVVATLIGVIAFVVYRRRRRNKSVGESDNKRKDIIDLVLDTKDEKYDAIVDKIESAKNDVLSFYEKNGKVLRDKKTGKSLSVDASRTAYWMVTRDIIKDRDAVLGGYSSNLKKNEVRKLVDAYLNEYLPNYFDQESYNVGSKWYKDILAKYTK